jgi:hypothetical protein
MTLSFNILGFQVASVVLDIERDEPAPAPEKKPEASLLNKGVKAMSGFWVDRMMR